MNTKKNKQLDSLVRKVKPTIFPLGFGVEKLENDIILIEFIDKSSELNKENSYVIIESIAMSKKRAIELKEALEKVINDE